MKAFFQRLALGGKDKEPSSIREKFSWPPPSSQASRPASSPPPASPVPSSNRLSHAFKPLPEIAPVQLREELTASRDTKPKEEEESPKEPEAEPFPETSEPVPARAESPRNARKTNYSDNKKQVAFKSPPPTPTPVPQPSSRPDSPPTKTTVSRFQAVHGVAAKEGRASSSSAASTSRVELASASKSSLKGGSTARNTQSPYLKDATGPSSQSLRSGTPYSQISQGSGSRILSAQSWSEVTEDDLVSNLGSRERTRQEVLFEIISSEDRYVQELIKMKDTFIDPLLHPFSTSTPVSPLASTPNLDYDYYRSESPQPQFQSADNLPPIAARFMSPSPALSLSTPQPGRISPIDADSILMTDDDEEGIDTLGQSYGTSQRQAGTAASAQQSKMNHPRSPYRSSATKAQPSKSVPFPSRSHHSLPPPPRPMNGSTHSLGRQASIDRGDRERNYSQGAATIKSSTPTKQSGVLRKFKKSTTSRDSVFGIGAIPPHLLPEDLKICLEVIDNGVLDGHKRLCEALKKRYDDQFPLVRSLADVFVSNSDIFQGYATYVLHLERALEQVDDALSAVSTKKPKKQDAAEYQKMCAFLRKLEESAAEKGETGLAITLSKPFQRLLKYPLLFQNLLFHTDPSTFEYESTLQMVAEVETIVRSIEDEKIQKEERDRTRDVFARIEGLEKVRQLALPKPSRMLVDERQQTPAGSANGKSSSLSPNNGRSPPSATKGKSTFRRLNDVLNPGSSKKDLWLVIFNDVVLQCQRTGTTSLPLVSHTNSRAMSTPEFQGKPKYATTGRRNSQTRPRNLYKFIKIETWAIGDVMKPAEGVVSMDDVARSRLTVPGSGVQPRIVPMPDDDEEDDGLESDDSDKKSKMSFSYWGADKVTVQKPVVKGRVVPVARRGGGASSYGRESSANAKFGTRLVSTDSTTNGSARPGQRKTTPVAPSTRRTVTPHGETEESVKSTVTKPGWNSSTRTPVTSNAKRVRNISQTSPPTTRPVPVNKVVSSPAPSHDSGIA
ncbi:hypothetical protein DL96DRAFT_1578503 [Flagelloscypha sp. PMI_526]|nr:hypothetical protein DL96DRAFT_1578503 [Flagelloscypha sp. PMI_526]